MRLKEIEAALQGGASIVREIRQGAVCAFWLSGTGKEVRLEQFGRLHEQRKITECNDGLFPGHTQTFKWRS